MSAYDDLISLCRACADDSPNASRLLRQQLLDRRCLLLQAAREERERGNLFARDEIQVTWPALRDAFALLFFPGQAPDETTLAARELLIQAALSDASSAEIEERIRRAIRIYEKLQGRAQWKHAADKLHAQWKLTPSTREPSWMNRLPNTGWQCCFRQIRGSFPDGWYDPALSLAGETIAWLLSDEDPWVIDRRQRTSPVQTLVLFATESGPSAGWVGMFSVWRVPDGGGYLYPHPLSCGYHSADASIAQSLRNAWFATVAPRLRQEQLCDICWRLRVVNPIDKLPLFPRLSGRSGEAAIACALRALLDNEPLDPYTAVSAQLAAGLTSDLRIAPVGGIEEKLTADQFGTRTERAKISDLVLDKDQQPSDEEIRFWGNLRRVQHLDDVYQWLSGPARMTREAKRNIADLASKELLRRCNADTPSHYVRSPLWVERRAQVGGDPESRQRPALKRVSPAALRRVITATQRAKRLRFFADSGVGKTTFLIYCQQRIATAPHDRVPILLPDLSEVPWAASEEEFYQKLANRCKAFLPGEEPAKIAEWLKRLREKGKLVFLLDALDQTDDEPLRQMHGWLQGAGGVQDCPVYVTGRPWTQSSTVFDATGQHQPWKTVTIGLLDRDQVGTFVGKEVADRLREVFPEPAKGDSQFPADDDVLRVPMVLSLLKNIAPVVGSEVLKNRERIYQAALERPWDGQSQKGGAIGKGIATLKAAPLENVDLLDIEPVCELLGVVAWEMLRRGNVRGYVEGPAYQQIDQLARQYAQDRLWDHRQIMQSLQQVNIFRLGEVFESGRKFLQWRHLSLCEYFAGWHLANRVLQDELDEGLSSAERTENARIMLGPILDMVAAKERALQRAGPTDGESRSPHDRWQWVFRFALSRVYHAWAEGSHHAPRDEGGTRRDAGRVTSAEKVSPASVSRNEAPSGTAAASPALNSLAGQLIAHGAAFVVHDAMRYDQVRLPQNLDRLCRWLVHWDFDWRRRGEDGDRREAWTEEQPPAVDTETLSLLRALFDRRYRHGPQLPAAWELIQRALRGKGDAAVRSAADEIRNVFLEDVSQALSDAETQSVREFVTSFRECPPDGFDFNAHGGNVRRVTRGSFEFQMGSREEDDDADSNERPRHAVQVRPFWMSAFCVNNALFELMDPSHFFDRDEISRSDDQPALCINWFMADLFSRLWLAAAARQLGCAEAGEYRLPSEAQWEFACRAGSDGRHWWGEEFDGSRCNAEGSLNRTLGETETTDAYRNAFGLYHMLGNNWQWCSDWSGDYDSQQRVDPEGLDGDAGRVARGGSWYGNGGDCRSAYRDRNWSVFRSSSLGFRVARRLSGK